MTRRAEFTRTTKLKAWEAVGGKCKLCERKLYPGDRVEFDHRITCEQGGDNSVKNCQVLCGGCHALKTRDDIKTTAKSRSVRAGHVGASRPKRPMPGSRDSKWKKKVSGEVVKR